MRTFPNSPWIDRENVKLLRQWWEEDGLTSFAISNKFKEKGVEVTRNAVIGRVHRMKLMTPAKKKAMLAAQAAARAKIFNVAKAQQAANKTIIIRGKKFNHNWKQKVDMSPDKPDGSKNVLLKDSKDGECKAVVGYVNGQASLAMYCGEATVAVSKNGIIKMTSWCHYHHQKYMTEDKR